MVAACSALLLMLAQAPLVHVHDTAATDGGLAAGALYDELARMDQELFQASFATCDAAKANAILADDVEFYHDKDGFSSGEQVLENTRRLTASCPGKHGVSRSVGHGSLRVYPIEGYGAVQIGVHRFDERGTSTSTQARFVHVWRKQGDRWRLARILSLDHQNVPAADSAGTRSSPSSP
jgi:ketosteroid isomerase-like protein